MSIKRFVSALLADAEHKKYAPQPKKQRYDFDF